MLSNHKLLLFIFIILAPLMQIFIYFTLQDKLYSYFVPFLYINTSEYKNRYGYNIINYILLDKPGKPGTPEVADYDIETADIKWNSPSSDGGSPITHYIIQQKLQTSKDWSKIDVFNTPTGNEVLEYKVVGLTESQKVQWRVIAVNKAGESVPSDPSPMHTVKHRKCKHKHKCLILKRKVFNQF